ncbi:hypothetical protein WJX84_004659 [Apatococcus fuscideae]|uniref:Uncharacterized protein n=1 Tax=Apatococcus fuscideae TaxID=2026836 RepID=A0AAW1T560_9CHLO
MKRMRDWACGSGSSSNQRNMSSPVSCCLGSLVASKYSVFWPEDRKYMQRSTQPKNSLYFGFAVVRREAQMLQMGVSSFCEAAAGHKQGRGRSLQLFLTTMTDLTRLLRLRAPLGRTHDGPNTRAEEDQPAKPAGARQAGKQQRVQTSQDAPCPDSHSPSTQGSGGCRRGANCICASRAHNPEWSGDPLRDGDG